MPQGRKESDVYGCCSLVYNSLVNMHATEMLLTSNGLQSTNWKQDDTHVHVHDYMYKGL